MRRGPHSAVSEPLLLRLARVTCLLESVFCWRLVKPGIYLLRPSAWANEGRDEIVGKKNVQKKTLQGSTLPIWTLILEAFHPSEVGTRPGGFRSLTLTTSRTRSTNESNHHQVDRCTWRLCTMEQTTMRHRKGMPSRNLGKNSRCGRPEHILVRYHLTE